MMTVAYVGTEGHHLITQKEANPGNPALCQQLTAQGAYRRNRELVRLRIRSAENDVFQLPYGYHSV